jgi:hypothetical protein
MPEKLYLIRLKQTDLQSHLVIAANAEMHEKHLVFLR